MTRPVPACSTTSSGSTIARDCTRRSVAGRPSSSRWRAPGSSARRRTPGLCPGPRGLKGMAPVSNRSEKSGPCRHLSAGARCSHWRTVDSAIPRQVAPLQSLRLFHRATARQHDTQLLTSDRHRLSLPSLVPASTGSGQGQRAPRTSGLRACPLQARPAARRPGEARRARGRRGGRWLRPAPAGPRERATRLTPSVLRAREPGRARPGTRQSCSRSRRKGMAGERPSGSRMPK
jgi:hypothetical protein